MTYARTFASTAAAGIALSVASLVYAAIFVLGVPSPIVPVLSSPQRDADLAVAVAAPRSQVVYERRMIEWARNLYDEAGLDLPHVDIRFPSSADECEGNQGTLRTARDGARIIRICADHPIPPVRDRWQRRALVHELAHLWEQTRVDDETRQVFMAHRGLSNWNDRSDEWRNRATEHAAEIVTWGLIDFAWLFVALPDNSCGEMLIGYRILTGLDPTHGPDLNCDA